VSQASLYHMCDVWMATLYGPHKFWIVAKELGSRVSKQDWRVSLWWCDLGSWSASKHPPLGGQRRLHGCTQFAHNAEMLWWHAACPSNSPHGGLLPTIYRAVFKPALVVVG